LVAKLKECEDVAQWKTSIINHLYWSVMSTPADDANRGDIILEKWLSVIDHLQVNIINYNVKLTCSPAPITSIYCTFAE